MVSETFILQSVGSLSVAVLALIMLIVQGLFFFRKPQFTWYAWSAAIAFSALLYSIGIFLEYNTLPGPLNRFSGLLEWTAIISLIHCLYGFTFSYLGIESKCYHPVAGACHGLILILLWSTNYLVADSFVTRNFIGLDSPYIEPALGPLGPLFELYAVAASIIAMRIWIKHRETDPKHRITYLAGIGVWILLGIHDGLASLGVPTLQYLMEYGFLGFAMAVLWVVFNSYWEIAAEKYRVITEYFNNLPLLAYNITFDGKINDINNVAVQRLGYDSKDELIGKPLISTVYAPSSQEKAKRLLEKWKREKILKNEELQVITKQGEIIDVLLNVDTVYDSNGEPFYSLSTQLDITERKRAEEALRQQKDEMQLILDSVPALIFCKDTNDRLTLVNKEVADQFKLSKEEFIGKTTDDIFPEQAEAMKRDDREVMETGQPKTNVVATYTTPEGLRWAHTGKVPYKDSTGKVIGLIGVSIDITERKRSEDELKRREEELRIITENIPGLVSYVDADGWYRFVNKQYEEWFGLPQKEIIGKHYKLILGDDTHKLITKHVQAALSGKHVHYQDVLPYKSGGTRWVNVNYVPDIDKTGNVNGFFALVTDITNLKEAERSLQESEEKYRSLVESTEDFIYLIDRDSRYLFMNKKYLSRFRLPKDKIIGKTYSEFHSEQETREFSNKLNEVFETGNSLSYEYRSERDGGYYIRTLSPVKEPDGEIISLTVVSKAITERKRAEEALRESEKKYRSILENIEESYYEVDLAGNLTFFNDSTCRLLGYSKDKLLGMNNRQFMDQENVEKVYQTFNKVYGTGKPDRGSDWEIIRKDGTKRYVEASVSLLKDSKGQPIGFRGTGKDVTERKHAEERIIFLAEVLSSSPFSVIATDKGEKITYVNPATERLFGYTYDELLGKNPIILNADPHAEKIQRDISNTNAQGKVWRGEILNKKKNGELFPVFASVYQLLDEEGNFIAVVGFQEDITERKRTEENLRQSEEQFRTIVETAPSLLIITDTEGNNMYVSPNCEQMTGYKEEDLLGKVVWWVHDDDLARVKETLNRVFGDRVGGRNFEYKAVKKNGEQWWASSSWELLHDGQGNFRGVVMQTLDITERKQAEEEVKRSQEQLRNLADHLQSVREEERTTVAREIHDELGQALTGLRMDLSWLAKKMPKEREELLEKIRSMAELTKTTLKTVQRISTKLRPGLLDDLGLIAAIEWQTEEFQMRTGIPCRLIVDPEEIMVDEKRSTALFRIFQETLTNIARHAQATRVIVDLKEKNGSLVLRVRDNGRGITKEQISDPKSFGLLGIRERVYPWGGYVTIRGTKNKGTTVTVSIPLGREEVSP